MTSSKVSKVLATLILTCILTGRLTAQSDVNEPKATEKGNTVHERYWLLDEIRTVSQALCLARTGRVGTTTSSRSAVPAGFGTLPLPDVTTPIKTDGKLDEPAWQKATSLPVGPIFADWRQGPFMLQVSACRDDNMFYLGIHSPHDLSQLTADFGSGSLFEIANQLYRVAEPSGDIKGGIVRKDSAGQTIELALPLPAEPIQLTFYTELVRRSSTSAIREEPTEKHFVTDSSEEMKGQNALETKFELLDPVSIKLIPAPHMIQFRDATSDPNQVQLSYTLRTTGRQSKKRTFRLQQTGESGVYRYRYAVKIKEYSYEIESLLYVEPVAEMLDAVREILSRPGNQDLSKPERDAISEAVEKIERELDDVESYDRKQWRRLYCEARRLKAKASRNMPKVH